MVIDRVQGLFVGVDEAQPTESQLGSWRCYNLIMMWLLAEGWQVIIYRFMYRWINIWLNVVEHVLIKHTGMMCWLLPAVDLKKYNTMQYEINVHHHQSLSHHCNEWCWLVWLILAVCAATSFSSVKMLCGMSLQRCVEQPDHGSTALNQVQQSLWGSRTSHPFDFNGGMTRKIISTFRLRLAQPAIATWARKRSPRLKSSTPYCSLVVSTPDVHR